jgi:D-beta-D-heptose 7-phosphate kinase/D-beta-D-heptose 1-phosphate adenosyltransferase
MTPPPPLGALSHADLSALLAGLTGSRVLVVGDVMLDRFVYGTVDRVSPEAPIPVVRVTREQAMLGGAGNVLRNLTALGARAGLLALVGDDEAGRTITLLVATETGDEAGAIGVPIVERGRITTIKERTIAGAQQLLRVDRESLHAPSEAVRRRLLADAVEGLESAGCLVLSDYGKGVLGPDALEALLAAAAEAGRPVVVDPKGRDYAVYRGAQVLTPNRRELHEATGLPTGDDAGIEAAARRVIETCGVGAVLATRSEAGMTLVEADRPVLHLPARAREVYDVSGAGDTVVAVVASALAAGAALPAAAELANLVAGIVVGKVGTAVALPGEVLDEIHRHDGPSGAGPTPKLVARDTLLDHVAEWRRAGLTVGFTNGCFDLLHPGHVSLLRQARAACDRLIVGLNSDASVRRLKGPARPVQDEIARAAVLGSLADVDRLVVFNEDTPLALIEAIRPDVLVKGADYSVDQVVGAEVVQAAGGRVLLATLEPGHSTTGTLRRLGADAAAG